MKQVSQAVKVGVLVLVLAIGSYGVWRAVGTTPAGADAYRLWIDLQDASGLPVGSRVMVAGLPVGEISSLDIVGRRARVTMRIRRDVEVWDNAVAMKKSSSLLGDFYIEIDPGLAVTVDADGQQVEHERLADGDQIRRVVEAVSPEDLMRQVEETIPKVDQVLLSVRDLSEDVRAIVTGPLASMAARLDDLVQEEADTLAAILATADRSLRNIEQVTRDIRGATDGADRRVDQILGNLESASANADQLMASARSELELTAAALRERLDDTQEILGHSASVARKIDEDEGTLGRLVNDPTIADNIAEITEDARDFTSTLFGLQTYVGLRSEYNVFSQAARSYVTVELHTRPDKYYLIEAVKGPRGNAPDVTLFWDADAGAFRRQIEIDDGFRFSFQFAKRLDWITLRYGIKESTGGVGADLRPGGGNLSLSLDTFDFAFDRLPRLRLAAAYQMFGHLYLLAGIDDALNAPNELDIIDDTDVPRTLQTYRYGRDAFAGAMIRFNDEDLRALLMLGGAALLGAAAD
jgi:phospholipid/cholesterol/gamma-HCH transport system substrate-binding protein